MLHILNRCRPPPVPHNKPPKSRRETPLTACLQKKSRIKPCIGGPASNSLPVLSLGEEGPLFTLWYPRLCSFSRLRFLKTGIKADTKLPAMIHTLSGGGGPGPLHINRPNTCWTFSLRISYTIHLKPVEQSIHLLYLFSYTFVWGLDSDPHSTLVSRTHSGHQKASQMASLTKQKTWMDLSGDASLMSPQHQILDVCYFCAL